MSGLTKAELERQLTEARERLAAAPKVQSAPQVPEADAIAGCVRALDALTVSGSASYGTSRATVDGKAVRRVLLYLSSKYGADLTEGVPASNWAGGVMG